MKLPSASTIYGPDDPRSWESWTEPWLGEDDGLRVVAIPEGEVNIDILRLAERKPERRQGLVVLRFPRERVVEDVLTILDVPARVDDRVVALYRRLCTEEEWKHAEGLAASIREVSSAAERRALQERAAREAETLRRALSPRRVH